MKVIFFGTPEFAVPTLERLLDHPDIEVIAVVTQPDKPRGRGSQLTPSPIKVLGLSHHLPIWQPKRIKKDAATLTFLRESEADVFVVAAYGQILSAEILAMPRVGCINVHGSILPKYRGAAPIQWSLVNGESQTGITTMLMDEGMDTGAMLLTSVTPITLLDNMTTLSTRLMEIGADLLIKTLEKLPAEGIIPIPQNPEEATYAPLIKPKDYELKWSRSAIELHNQVRGFFPHCETTFRDQPLKIMATVPLGDAYWHQLPSEFKTLAQNWSSLSQVTGQPGEIVQIVKKFGPIIQTGDGLLLLREVKPPAKKAQSGLDFANGYRVQIGEIMG